MSLSFVYPQYLWLLSLIPLTLWLGWLGRRSLTPQRLWSGLALRAVILLLLILALAGIQFRYQPNLLTTVFVLDVSDSIPENDQSWGKDFIRQAVQGMQTNDQAAIVVFGADALVDQLKIEFADRLVPEIASIPVSTATDIASALQLAQAVLPAEGSRRIFLLSDGRENLKSAVEQAPFIAQNNIQLLYAPLGGPPGNVEVLVDKLEAPSKIRLGQEVQIIATLNATAPVNASLRFFAGGKLVETREIRLPADQVVTFTYTPTEAGFQRFRVQVVPDADTRLQNNEASAFVVVDGPPRILVVETDPADGENLTSALQANQMTVDRLLPGEIPTSLDALASYDAVILANVNASALAPGAQDALQVFVRELGKGLVMIGGTNSYGAGGYLRSPLEKALPVDMDVKDKDLQANLALVLAVDKSGSMGRCHCDNPDLNQTYTRREVGQPKVDIAKEAIMRAASALGMQDFLGVVAFDNAARWVLPLDKMVDPYVLEQAIGGFQAIGNTNLESGVVAAYQALQGVSARRKHIILLTDGWVRTGDLTSLALKMKDQGITLSVVAAGEGSAQYLAALSQFGGGSYYPATDVFNVPDIFLKETVKSAGRYIIEEPFYPVPVTGNSPILRGLPLDQLPALLGYNGTTAKNTARIDLVTPRGDPLLASWQFGLGRAAVWTSDLKGQWAKDWLAWQGFSTLVSQLVSSVLPAPQVEGLTARLDYQEGKLMAALEAVDKNGQPLNFLNVHATLIDPELKTSELVLKQVGAGLYQAQAPISMPGAYLARVGANHGDQSLGQVSLGAIVPYSPEYQINNVKIDFFTQIQLAIGREPKSPQPVLLESPTPEQAFQYGQRPPSQPIAREIWRPLLILAALFFPLDVAIRRLILGPEDLHKARAWLFAHLPGRRETLPGERPHLLDQLFQARDRVRHRSRGEASAPTTPSSPYNHSADASPQPLPPSPETPANSQPSSEDSLARLHAAKKRARRN